nr:CREB-binding protein-like [Penaeus vannamei]
METVWGALVLAQVPLLRGVKPWLSNPGQSLRQASQHLGQQLSPLSSQQPSQQSFDGPTQRRSQEIAHVSDPSLQFTRSSAQQSSQQSFYLSHQHPGHQAFPQSKQHPSRQLFHQSEQQPNQQLFHQSAQQPRPQSVRRQMPRTLPLGPAVGLPHPLGPPSVSPHPLGPPSSPRPFANPDDHGGIPDARGASSICGCSPAEFTMIYSSARETESIYYPTFLPPSKMSRKTTRQNKLPISQKPNKPLSGSTLSPDELFPVPLKARQPGHPEPNRENPFRQGHGVMSSILIGIPLCDSAPTAAQDVAGDWTSINFLVISTISMPSHRIGNGKEQQTSLPCLAARASTVAEIS